MKKHHIAIVAVLLVALGIFIASPFDELLAASGVAYYLNRRKQQP